MNVRFGYRNVEFPSATLGVLRDSSGLLSDVAALHARMAEDGYLLLRGLIDRQKVLTARETILAHMREKEALTPDTPLLEGVMPRRAQCADDGSQGHCLPSRRAGRAGRD